jgi:CxxC motif-containing protein
MELLAFLRGVKIKAPVKEGDILVKDALDTGIAIVASRDM